MVISSCQACTFSCYLNCVVVCSGLIYVGVFRGCESNETEHPLPHALERQKLTCFLSSLFASSRGTNYPRGGKRDKGKFFHSLDIHCHPLRRIDSV